MATSEIKANKGAVVHEINGVKYFKLQSPYAGDYTKNCGLLGNEIDENFFFLRSNDIESMDLDSDWNLTLTKVDGDTLTVNIKDNSKYKFEFHRREGELVITYPDGEQEILGGFLVMGHVKVATNETLKGQGTHANPLGLSEVEETGTYAPALKLIDLTQYTYYVKKQTIEGVYYYEEIEKELIPQGVNIIEMIKKMEGGVDKRSPEYVKVSKNGHNLPDDPELGKGYRVVTKESVDTFGLLYDYEGVKAIADALAEKGSPWRIPSRKDWADMLNAAEYCDEYRTHDTECINEWTGKDAGARAKSVNLWKTTKDEEMGLPVGGEDNLPISGGKETIHIMPVGYGEGSRGARDKDFDIEAIKKLSSFWSSTEIDCSTSNPNVYTRTFSYDSRMVLQESSKPSSRLSIRLVRDFKKDLMNVNHIENILGYNLPVVLVTNRDTDYSKVWTAVNVGFLEPQYHGVGSDQWDKISDEERGYREVYFINEWNGEKWVKKQMEEGDSVVLIDGGVDENGEFIYNHEWRIYRIDESHVELIDTLDALKREIKKDLDKIQEELDNTQKGAGLDEDGNYIPKPDNRYTNESDSLASAIDDLDKALGTVEDKVDGLQIVEVDPTGEKILKSYELHNVNGERMGVTIDVPKDKAIHNIFTGYSGTVIDEETGEIIEEGTKQPECLYFIYKDETGIYRLVAINIEKFLFEHEFKDGLEVVKHNVKVKIDKDSDKDWNGEHYLKVSLEGVKLEGVSRDFEKIRESVGLENDGAYVNEKDPKYFIKGETIKEDINLLDEHAGQIQVEVDRIEEAVGLDEDGNYIPRTDSNYINSATTVMEAIDRIDEVANQLQTVVGVDDEEMETKTIDFALLRYVKIEKLEDETLEEFKERLHELTSGQTIVDMDVVDDEVLHEMLLNLKEGETIPKFIHTENTEAHEEEWYSLEPETNYIYNETTVKGAIIELDKALKKETDGLKDAFNDLEEKLNEEIERAKDAEKQLQDNIDEEARIRGEVDDFLNGQDIADGGYVMNMEDGLDLNRKNGDKIHIDFDADFGEI